MHNKRREWEGKQRIWAKTQVGFWLDGGKMVFPGEGFGFFVKHMESQQMNTKEGGTEHEIQVPEIGKVNTQGDFIGL